MGSPAAAAFGSDGPGGFNQSTTLIRLNENAPENTAEVLRNNLPSSDGRTINVLEIVDGPPQAGLDIIITGPNYADISAVAVQLADELSRLPGVENITSDVSEARDEIVINVDPARAASVGLSTQQVAFQVNQVLTGQTVTQIEVDGQPVDVVLAARTDRIDSLESLGGMMITGRAL